MSKPRYRWWGYVRNLVRDYPALDQELQDLRSQQITSSLDHVHGHGIPGRSTEDAALRQLSPAKQAAHDAISKAIEQTRSRSNGEDRIKLIDMVFWRQTHTLDGAAYALGYSYDRAKQLQGDFLRLVGFNRGLEDK